MSIHDPTSIDPVRFAASVIVEAVCEHVCELPTTGALREAFDVTLDQCHGTMPPPVSAALQLALEAEGYFDAHEWPNKDAMIELVQRVASRLRS